MAPLKALPKTVSDAKKKGLVPVTDFFGLKVKRDRRTMAAWNVMESRAPSNQSSPGCAS